MATNPPLPTGAYRLSRRSRDNWIVDSDGTPIGLTGDSGDDVMLARYERDSSGNVTWFVGPRGEVIALSETTAYVNLTATGTAFTGACEFAGYICTVAAGNITIYDNTSAAGTVIVPTTALAVGAFPIFGSGTNGKMALVTGCHVVLSGAATVNILVQ